MSAFIVGKDHVDVLVRAALRSGTPGNPSRSGYRFRFWRTDEEGKYAGWYEVDPLAEEREGDDYCTPITPSQLGQILVSENVRSVRYRYSQPGRITYYGEEAAAELEDLEDEELPGPIDAYYIAPYVYTDPRYTMTPAEVFKAIDCLDYQSCEHPGWRSSDAFTFCEALREAYCRKVVGYEDAPWEWTREKVPA